MTTDEASRLRLYDAARRTLGNDEADTLMAGLAPSSMDWTELTTKTDLRSEIATLGAELRGEIATLGAELRAEVATLEARMLDRMVSQTRTIVVTMVASNATLVGLVLAALLLAGTGG